MTNDLLQVKKLKKITKSEFVKLKNSGINSGYSFIELLVAIVIIAIIFQIGYANFRDFARRKTLTASQRAIQADLRYAQQLALSGKKPLVTDTCGVLDGYRFSINAGLTYTIYPLCDHDIEVTPVKSNVPIQNVSAVDINYSISTTVISSIKFKALGQGTDIPSGDSVVITLHQTGTTDTTTVTISAGGEIR